MKLPVYNELADTYKMDNNKHKQTYLFKRFYSILYSILK